jgi:tetratricopeptide (TPR) repeat protein
VRLGLARYDETIADATAVIGLDPAAAGAYMRRGLAWSKKQDQGRAILDFNEAIRLSPQESDAFLARGYAWSVRKEYDKAIADFNEAIRLDSRSISAHTERAWLRATCPEPMHRDGKQAVESATRACALTAWKNAGPISTLAAAHAEAGDFDAAVQWEETAQRLYDDDGDRDAGRARLELYREKKPYHEGPDRR